MTIWKPNVTVASIVTNDAGQYLMVEEAIEGEVRLNQPAGHLEPNESLMDACLRETYEETGWRINVKALIGIFQWPHPENDRTYLRFCFEGTTAEFDDAATLDEGIIRAIWLNADEIHQRKPQWRSPMVGQCIEEFEQGKRYPTSLITSYLLNHGTTS